MIKQSVTVFSCLSVLIITAGSALAIELSQPSSETPHNSVSIESGVAKPTQQPKDICATDPKPPGC